MPINEKYSPKGLIILLLIANATKAEIKVVPKNAITALLIVFCLNSVVIKIGKTSNNASL